MNVPALVDPVSLAPTALVRRFVAWLPQAPASERAEAVSALARAYLYSDMTASARAEAQIALTQALDDPEPPVRRALAEALASARNAPRALVLALAADVSFVSRAVLAQSPLLRDAELAETVAIGDAAAQAAIARRVRLGAAVAAAIAEIGERPAVLTLLANLTADVDARALWRAFQRFGDDEEARERLAARPSLPAALRAALAAAEADATAASRHDLDPARRERLARDAREQAWLAIAASAGAGAELADLIAWLRASGHLTPGLLTRALAGGDLRLFAHSLADLAGLPTARVAGIVAEPAGQAFRALYRRAGLPTALRPGFCVLVKLAAAARGGVDGLPARMLRAVEALEQPALAAMTALLGRLCAQAARADARDYARLADLTDATAPLVAVAQIDAATAALRLNVEPGNENHAPPVTLSAEAAPAIAA